MNAPCDGKPEGSVEGPAERPARFQARACHCGDVPGVEEAPRQEGGLLTRVMALLGPDGVRDVFEGRA